jgi:hypothetical protein
VVAVLVVLIVILAFGLLVWLLERDDWSRIKAERRPRAVSDRPRVSLSRIRFPRVRLPSIPARRMSAPKLSPPRISRPRALPRILDRVRSRGRRRKPVDSGLSAEEAVREHLYGYMRRH